MSSVLVLLVVNIPGCSLLEIVQRLEVGQNSAIQTCVPLVHPMNIGRNEFQTRDANVWQPISDLL